MVAAPQQLIDFTIYQNSSDKNFHHLLLMEADLFNSSVIEWILRNSNDNVNKTHNNDSIVMLVMITICYLIICLAAIVGNLITCIVIYKNKNMHTATNFYLFNLAVSDFLLLVFGLPPEVYNNIWFPAAYPFSNLVCVIQSLLQETATNATVLTILTFSVERYIAICHPFRAHTMSTLSRALKCIVVIWMLAVLLAAPQALQFGVIVLVKGQICSIKRRFLDFAFEISSFIFFVGPMILICVLYILISVKLKSSKLIRRNSSEQNQSIINNQAYVIRMLVAVVATFFICWAPFHMQRLMAVYGSLFSQSISVWFHRIYSALTYVSGVLYFLSTCINPVLYSLMSNKFRRAFKETLSRCGKSKERCRSSNFQHAFSQKSHHNQTSKRSEMTKEESSFSLFGSELSRFYTNKMRNLSRNVSMSSTHSTVATLVRENDQFSSKETQISETISDRLPEEELLNGQESNHRIEEV